MTRLDVVSVPSLLHPSDLQDATAVVIDVLRATSTMATALAHGAGGIIPVATPEQAFAVHSEFPEQRLIGGERLGKPLPGFHLGNSPCEYIREVVQDKQIVLTTTNGTQALLASESADQVWIASFLNRRACCEVLQEREQIVLVCSGKEGRFCLEDTICAGALVDHLQNNGPLECTDAAEAAYALYRHWAGNLPGLLHQCEHGRYLASIGLTEDLSYCAQLDILSVNGLLQGGIVGRIETDSTGL